MPDARPTMVVAGASGVVGRHLVSHAKAKGWTVRTLSRSDEEATTWEPEKIVEEGGEHLLPVQEALEGTDLVVNLAGASLADGKLDVDHGRRVMSSRIHSTRALALAYRECAAPPPCWIQASAVGYYGETGEEYVTEESPQGGLFLSQVCEAWEETAREAEEGTPGRPRLIIVRFGLVFASDAPAWEKMNLPIRMGLGGPLGEGTQWYSWIEAADMARAVLFLHDTPGAEGIYNLASPGPVRQIDLAKKIGKHLHRPTLMPTPAFALRLALGKVADELLLPSCRALPKRLEEEGFTFDHPGIDATLEKLFSRKKEDR